MPCNCKICKLGIHCQERNFVYEATCKQCNEIYVGASARQAKKRLGEYESSIRLDSQTNRTTLGKHNLNVHGKQHNNIHDCYSFKILDRGNDPINTFIREGIHLKIQNPQINENKENGFYR